ncbi:hypothetical protein H9X96_18420 [Pedobacter sp. N36a]|uniref:hypothetical protein n=1 Tax=Pedobacter sp. N36a TaxID=2767996 RepID=UPI001656E355|nr:hypothetical protein [Pedobacter sp. N36a]MBC8987743.1 hypothetical protein [Pedobacter sp. N36a]
MPNNLHSILDHPFRRGQNTNKFELTVDLRLLRKFHKIAEFEAQFREQIILDNGEILYLDLDDNNSLMTSEFKMDFNIPCISGLINFGKQIDHIKRKLRRPEQFDNLLFLALQLIIIDKRLFKTQYNRYQGLKREIDNISLIGSYAQLNNLSGLELTFLDKNPTKRPKIIATERLPRFIVLAILKPYVSYLFSDYLEDLSGILNRELTEDTITYGDLLEVKNKMRKIKVEDYEKAFHQYFLLKLLNYIRVNNVISEKKPKHTHPDSDEARLVYFISCITKQHSILPKSKPNFPRYFENMIIRSFNGAGSSKSTNAEKIINYNDSIINGVKKKYQDLEKSENKKIMLYYITDIDQEIFELSNPNFPFV